MGSEWVIDHAQSVGRIVIAPNLPPGFVLFYTSADSAGTLDNASIDELRRILRDRFHIDAELASCSQVHGVEVVRAEPGKVWCEHSGCDALFTTSEAVALGIKVADCLPVTLIDPVHSIIANIHSGWRGAAARIVNRTVATLRADAAFDAGRSSAWLGPSIRSCCFEVGEEVVEQLGDAYGNVDRFVDRSSGVRPHVDLAGLTRDLLEQEGFPSDAIHDSGLCTRCEGSIFHSYRRNGPRAGRNLAIVAR